MIGPKVVEAAAVRPLRHLVLRPDQPVTACVYVNDDAEDTVHLAVVDESMIVLACGSLYPAEDWRIRGMATAPALRRCGFGSAVLAGLLAHAVTGGAASVWCNARESAQSFYSRHGFVVEGDDFLIPGLGPHRVMRRPLSDQGATGAAL